MPLPNRVAPDGSLHANPARGLLTGNRGVIHDPCSGAPAGRRWTTRAWICCALSYKDVRRSVWGRNRRPDGSLGASWSELFFLDDVTALAAGHRPCFACRREAAERFIACFDAANGLSGRDIAARDAILHAQRRQSAKRAPRRLSAVELAALPDGVVVEAGGQFHAMRRGRALRWSFEGYGEPAPASILAGAPASLVTPPSTVLALRAGHAPLWHRSAG